MQAHYAFPPDALFRRPVYVSLVGYDGGDHYRYARTQNADALAFEYVVEGRMAATIDALAYRPGPGDVYLLQPGSCFEVRDCGERWHKLWFVARGRLLESLLSAYGLANVYYIEQCPVRPVFERMLHLAASAETDRGAIQDQLSAVFYEALIQLSTIVVKKGLVISEDVLVVKNYLDTHITSQVSLLELGGLVDKSRAHVIRVFKREMGLTPYAYFLGRKIAYAKVLLAYSDAKVREIAEHLGFSDEYYFSNVFKKKAGMSPSAYRRGRAEGRGGTLKVDGGELVG